MRTYPWIMRQAVCAYLSQIVSHWGKWFEVLLIWPHGRKQIAKTALMGVSFHSLQHPSRVPLPSRLLEKTDFQGADCREFTVRVEVFVRPSNHFVPTSVRKLLSTRN